MNYNSMEQLGDGVAFIDKDLRIVSWSDSAERITGYTQEQVLGQPCKQILGSQLCETNCTLRRVLASGEPVSSVVATTKTAQKTKISLTVSATPLKDTRSKVVGAVLTFRNLSEIQAISNELTHERNTLCAILESIADGVFTVDAEWRITSFNRAAERITGFRREEAIGKECSSIFRSNACKETCPLRESMRTRSQVSNFEIFIISKRHKRVPISVSSAALVDEEGDVIGGVETFRDLSELKYLSSELSKRYSFANIIGKSPRMQEIYQLLETVSDTSSTVLVLGETGTGKELVARAVHYNSARKEKPFVKVLCAALPENLLESELFGHVRGAFTGAIRDKPGRFEMAHGGTMFLDEIAEISPAVQAKLLRVLESGEFERVGGLKTIKTDVRIVAATNRDLKSLIREGQFREDLYYRLNVIAINLPPLRDRRDDIPLLIQHLVAKFALETGKEIERVSPQVMDILLDHDWPGNVRQLENAVEHAFVHCRGKTVQVQHLPEELIHPEEPVISSGLSLEEAEKELILGSLERNNWSKTKTARELKVPRTTLWRKIKKYGIE
jgi:PAS domain S-box-containing protein